MFLIVTALCGLALAGACSKKETLRTQEGTGDAVNDAVDAARGALKKVTEGINNAVYK